MTEALTEGSMFIVFACLFVGIWAVIGAQVLWGTG